MMLSMQAARMGSFSTTLRRIGCRSSKHFSSSTFTGIDEDLVKKTTSATHKKQKTMVVRRNNSSIAATVGDWTDDESSMNSPAAAAFVLQQQQQNADPASTKEAWMVNLGRKDDNAWLSGPRDEQEWFTGVPPSQCPGTDTHGIIRSLPLPNLSAVTRANAQEYFDNSWTLYETLFAGLHGEEGFYRPPPHGLRHPQIFYYGHTACLYVNKLRVAGVLDSPVNAYFESIFEVGVDEMLWDDMHKNDMVWPTVSEVHAYRKQVYDVVVQAIANHSSLDGEAGVKVNQDHPMWALFMGFEHERIHLETSSVLFRETPFHLVQKPANWPTVFPPRSDAPVSGPVEGVDYPANRMVPVEHAAPTVDLGKPADFPSFGWDNEYGERTVDVPAFAASEHMITNGEFYDFVQSGGYRDQQFWSDDAWSWRQHRNRKWPFFWEPAGPAGSHEYYLRTVFAVHPMQWDWPVEVNYYEAKAYCAWKSVQDDKVSAQPYRLLAEAEHHLIRQQDHNLDAARKNVAADKVMVTSGDDFRRSANLNLAYGSASPVDHFPPSETGHRDTTGNAWEWTEDHFNPLKGFEVHHVYDDFSSPCFDGKHSMIVGGSFCSTGDEASVFARFHFRPHFLQHSGFRLVTSDGPAPAKHLYANFDGQAAAAAAASSTNPTTEEASSDNVYETDDSLHMYLGLHYPSSGDTENVPPFLPHANAPTHGLGFPQRVAGLLQKLQPNGSSALDIGCAVGGASFALAQTYDRVDAFDFSASFVQAAKRMQSDPETVSFRIPMEAEIDTTVQAVHDEGVTEAVRDKVNFFVGNACELQAIPELQNTKYDGAILSNLLCRLPDPVACLDGLHGILQPDGVVVMVTPFSWLPEFTHKANWLGGYRDPVTREPIYSKDTLQRLMEERGFAKIHEEQMPLIIREHQRKMQYIVSEATAFRKIE